MKNYFLHNLIIRLLTFEIEATYLLPLIPTAIIIIILFEVEEKVKILHMQGAVHIIFAASL